MILKEEVLVSICCLAYNHEEYIRDCIEGFLLQKTNFRIEILIHDDASTDKTAEIIKEYEQKFPNLFNNVYQVENQFKKQNVLVNILFEKANGKYIAFCEGDDYWTDPLKLQKQIDVLERDRGISIVGHESVVKYWNNSQCESEMTFSQFRNIPNVSRITPVEFIDLEYPFQSATVVFRNIFPLNKCLIKILNNCYNGDMVLYFILFHYGDAYMINEEMSVYNIRSTGITHKYKGSTLIEIYKNSIWVVDVIDKNFNNKYTKKLNELKLRYFDRMLFNREKYENKFAFFRDCLIFLFSNKYGSLFFIQKLKIVFKNVK